MARQASQGKRPFAAGAANPFALLGEGDDEEGAQDDDDEMAEAVQSFQLGD